MNDDPDERLSTLGESTAFIPWLLLPEYSIQTRRAYKSKWPLSFDKGHFQ